MIRRPPRSTLFPTRRSSDLSVVRAPTPIEGVPDSPEDTSGPTGAGAASVRDEAVAHPPHRLDPVGAELAAQVADVDVDDVGAGVDRKSTRLNSSHANISYAV